MEELLQHRHVAFFCLALVAVGLEVLPEGGLAQEAVALRALVIDASNEPGGVDAKLGSLAGELQKLPYSAYRLQASPQGSAALNQTWRTDLPGGRSLEITPTAVQGGQYSLKVRVLGPGGQILANTEVRLRSGSPFLVAVPTSQKNALIIAISAG
ncbi:MAG TPA: hypothetical protein VLT62_16465 [Candidatus Methylomirabilis sp.]|nr:hypothetical protein [Candidatus Methylomirabilis sp.]